MEAYTVASRLEMTSNAGQVAAALMAEFSRLNREIKASQETLGRFSAEMKALSSNSRGINAMVGALDKLTGAARGMEAVQTTLTRGAQSMATAYREAAAAARGMGGGSGGGSGGRPRAPAGGGPPGGWPQAWRDNYPNAQYDNSNVDRIANNNRALAERENAAMDSRTRTAEQTAAAARRAADGQYRNDFALATHENAARDAASNRGRLSHGDIMAASMGAQQVGDAGLGFFGKSIMAEAEVAQQLAGLRMNNTVTDADVTKARGVAERIARETPGTTIAENLHHIVDAFTVTGELNEALAGAPAVARMAYVLKNMPGAHKGDSSFAAMQAIEVMQRFYDPSTHKVSMEAFNQQLAAMTQVAVGTGGRVDGSAYLGFAKSARVGGMAANDEFLYRDLPAMLISLGGSRAGTGEAATFQQFITGRMTERAADQLKAAGILDQSATWKGGSVSDMQKHMPGFEMFGTNPVEYVRKYMLGSEGALQRNKVDPNDRLAVAKFLSDWSSRQTGLGFMAEMTLGMGGITKEGQKIGQTTTNPMQVMQQSDPMQRMREFHAAENEMMVAFGQGAIGPALEAMKGLTKVIRDLSDWAKAHPNAAGDITLIVGGLGAMFTAAGQLATVVFVGGPLLVGFRALAGALSPFAAGGAAAGAMVALPAGLSGVGIALVALAGAVVGIPKIFEGIAGALGLRGGQDLHGGGKGDRSGIKPDATGASPWGALGNLFGGGGAQNPASSGPSHGGGKGSRSGIIPQSYMMQPANDTRPIQVNAVMMLDGREVGRAVTTHQSREASGPARGITNFDLRETPMQPGVGAVAV